MIIKGLVTGINERMLTFEVENATTVHMVLMFSQNPLQKLPSKGTTVEVESPIFFSNEFDIHFVILLPNSLIKGDFCLGACSTENIFLNIVKNMNLKPLDLLEIAKNFNILKKKLTPVLHTTVEELMICFLQKISRNLNKNSDRVFPNFEFKVLSQLQYIGDPNNYKNYSYWTYGNHWNWNASSKLHYLVGYLFVFRTGIIHFTDFKRQIPCIIKMSDDISKFIDNYIIIKDYTVLTEIYNSQNICCLEYLLVDAKDITVLDRNERKNSASQASVSLNGYKCVSCRIISKSVPFIKSKNDLEYWLQIESEDGSEPAFLRLNKSYIKIYPTLKQGCKYKLYFKNKINKVFNKEISALNLSLPLCELSSGAIFIQTATAPRLNHVMNVSEANQQISNSSRLISFQGKISLKKFVNPLSSRTHRLSEDSAFGTPGIKTHLLEFKTDDGKSFTVYLNNWENMVTPYCLIPNMRVIVHNVVSQKAKYYKSTPLTSFEVINYEPEARFDTVNLCSSDWGLPYFLGGRGVPFGTIIWAKSPLLFILGLKIHTDPVNSGKFNSKTDIKITLIANDPMGESKVIAKDKTAMLLLRLILGAQEPVFQKWYQGMNLLGTYEYWKGIQESSDTHSMDKKQSTRRALTRYFKLLEKFRFGLDVKCRKMDEEPSGKSVYFLLDVRKG